MYRRNCMAEEFITTEQLNKLGEELKMTEYGQYILSISENKS